MSKIEFIPVDDKNMIVRLNDVELTLTYSPPLKSTDAERLKGWGDLSRRADIVTRNGEDVLGWVNYDGLSEAWTFDAALKSMFKVEGDATFTGPRSLDDLLGKVVRDKSGRALKVGDYIVYPTVMASSGYLKYGRILEIRPGVFEKGHDKIVVIGEYDSYYNPQKSKLQKPSTLQYPARTLAIDMRMLPTALFEAMDKYEIAEPKPRKKKK